MKTQEKCSNVGKKILVSSRNVTEQKKEISTWAEYIKQFKRKKWGSRVGNNLQIQDSELGYMIKTNMLGDWDTKQQPNQGQEQH